MFTDITNAESGTCTADVSFDEVALNTLRTTDLDLPFGEREPGKSSAGWQHCSDKKY